MPTARPPAGTVDQVVALRPQALVARRPSWEPQVRVILGANSRLATAQVVEEAGPGLEQTAAHLDRVMEVLGIAHRYCPLFTAQPLQLGKLARAMFSLPVAVVVASMALEPLVLVGLVVVELETQSKVSELL